MEWALNGAIPPNGKEAAARKEPDDVIRKVARWKEGRGS
jgi:hypothetical protein